MTDIRWIQRFENFERAYLLLRGALQVQDPFTLSDLEKEGVIQRFEYTFELAWKTLKDYLEHGGISFEQVTPRAVVKAAYAAKLIADGQIWIDMLEQRNQMAHTYNQVVFEQAFRGIVEHYATALEQVYARFKHESQPS